MSQDITFNGVTFTVPDVGDEGLWGADLTDYFIAIPQGCLQKTGGTFTLTQDVNFGAAKGLLAAYFSSRTASPSTAGTFRLAKTDSIGWKNNAGGGNLLLGINASDQLTFDGTAIYPGGITALTGDVTATGPGSVAATIAANAVTNAKFRQSAALSVVGNSTNSTANVADIAAGTDHFVFVRSGTALTWALLVNSNIDAAAAITRSKLATGTNYRILANSSSGVMSENAALTASQLITGDANGQLQTLAAGSQYQVLVMGAANPGYGQVNLAQSAAITGTLPVGNGGLGIVSGTSGGILGFTASTTIASSALLAANQIMLGGGAGATPTTLSAGSQYQVLVMGASNPGYGQVNLAQSAAITGVLPIANGGTGAATVNANLHFLGPIAGSAAAPSFRAPVQTDLLSGYVGTTVQTFTSGTGTYNKTYIFTCSSANATAAATYTNNAQTFTVVNTIASGTVLQCTGTGAPSASGTLTKSAGTGDSTITFSAVAAPFELEVIVVGSGGGGRGSGTTTSAGNGSNGSASTFGSSLLTANGGTGSVGTSGGAGGTATIASPAVGYTITGGTGGVGFDTGTTSIFAAGGFGGSSGLIGGPSGALNTNAAAAIVNSGTGGAGAGNGSSVGNRAGGGGGGGGYLRAFISSPSATYTWAVGALGGGGTAGTSGFIGGDSGSGRIIVIEKFQ